MKLSIAIAQGRWEIAAHLVVIGLVRASRRSGKRNHTGDGSTARKKAVDFNNGIENTKKSNREKRAPR